MSRDTEPVVESWYEDLETGRRFEVVDFDEDDAEVEIRYLDGDTETIDLDEWYELDLEQLEPPEEWDDTGDAGAQAVEAAEVEEEEEEEEDKPKRGNRRRVLHEDDDEEDAADEWNDDGDRWGDDD
ncbi:MAG: DUF6763 family protein [Gammaproteobacteria bacterium]